MSWDTQWRINMTSKFLRIIGYAKGDRSHMISALRDLINENGGWILDFKLFSNISICINFEISAKNVERLRMALLENNVQLSDESSALLMDFCNQLDPSDELSEAPGVMGAIQVTFIHNEPDLRIEVPAIPG
jgi:hypothetical protein